MSLTSTGVPARLLQLADAVLLPCFDGLTAPDWVRRRVGESLGGVCLFARNVADIDQIAALSAQLAAERDSVVIAIDEEAGDVTRIDAATGSRFPGAAVLGEVDNATVTQRIGHEVGDLLSTAGISLNLAPSADVTLDLDNPVIGSRAFGREPELVARHAAAWIIGHQRAGVAACAKHFPGHGDTNTDSHQQLSVLSGDREAIYRDSLLPFVAAIKAGSLAVMPGHLLAPAIDDKPATVSHRWLTEILRGELGFAGTIVTDALEMRGVADTYGIPGAAVAALRAGADLLCIGGQTRPEEEITAIRDAIVGAVIAGELGEERLAQAAEHSRAVGIAAARQRETTPTTSAGPVITVTCSDNHDRDLPALPEISLQAARQALHIVGEFSRLAEPIVIIRCDAEPNIAVGVVPWGPAITLDQPVTEIVMGPDDELSAPTLAAAGTVLIITRDRHRYPWMRSALVNVRTIRPDAVLVEMGITGVTEQDSPAIATFGATLASSYAVGQLLSSCG